MLDPEADAWEREMLSAPGSAALVDLDGVAVALGNDTFEGSAQPPRPTTKKRD